MFMGRWLTAFAPCLCGTAEAVGDRLFLTSLYQGSAMLALDRDKPDASW